MKSEAFLYYTDQNLTLIAFAIFVMVFSGVLFQVFRRSMQGHYKYMSELPFNDNKGETLK